MDTNVVLPESYDLFAAGRAGQVMLDPNPGQQAVGGRHPHQLRGVPPRPVQPRLLGDAPAPRQPQGGVHRPAHHPATEHDPLPQQLGDTGQDRQQVGQLSLPQDTLNR